MSRSTAVTTTAVAVDPYYRFGLLHHHAVTVQCPYCSRIHLHGLPPGESLPTVRQAHCAGRDYRINPPQHHPRKGN